MHYRPRGPRLLNLACSVSLADAVRQLLGAKRAANRRPKTLVSMGVQLRHFTSFCHGLGVTTVNGITRQVVEQYMGGSKSPVDANNRLRRVSVLCSFAVRRDWLPANPCSRVEAPTIDRKPPAIWSVKQCKLALETVHKCHRPMMVLGLFVGLRPAEVERLDWSNVRLDATPPVVVVDTAASKIRQRRIVPLQQAAVAWLRLDALQTGPICCPQSSTRMRMNARRAGLQCTPDVLRHTYASMRYASGIAAAQLSQEMGNSEAVLMRHYREIVSADEAGAFFALRP